MPLPGSGGRAGGRSLAPSAESPAPRRPGHSMAVLAADFPLGFPPPCEPGSDRPATPQCAGRPQSLWRPTRQLRPAFQRSPRTAIRDPHGGWSHRGSPLHWAPPPSGAPCRPRRVGSAGQSARPLPCLSLAQNQEADRRGQALGRRGLGHDCGGCWGRPIAGRLVGVGHLPVARHVGAGGHHCPPGEAALVFLVIGAGAWGGAVGVRCLGTAEPLTPCGPVCPTCTQEAD